MLNSLEDWLAGVYKDSPRLSPAAKKSIVDFWPWVALVFGVLQLLAALSLWHTGHQVNQLVTSFNSIYGSVGVELNHLNAFYWLSLIVLIVDGLILLAAYPRLRVNSKDGWNLVFYGALLNFVYGIFSAFNNYGNVGSFILQLLLTVVVLYLLFQIRDHYAGRIKKSDSLRWSTPSQ